MTLIEIIFRDTSNLVMAPFIGIDLSCIVCLECFLVTSCEVIKADVFEFMVTRPM